MFEMFWLEWCECKMSFGERSIEYYIIYNTFYHTITQSIHWHTHTHTNICTMYNVHIYTTKRNPYGKTYHKPSAIYIFSGCYFHCTWFLLIMQRSNRYGMRETERKIATLEMTLIDLMSVKQKVDIYTRGYKIADALSLRQLISVKICWTFLQANLWVVHNHNIITITVKCNICTKIYQA